MPPTCGKFFDEGDCQAPCGAAAMTAATKTAGIHFIARGCYHAAGTAKIARIAKIAKIFFAESTDSGNEMPAIPAITAILAIPAIILT